MLFEKVFSKVNVFMMSFALIMLAGMMNIWGKDFFTPIFYFILFNILISIFMRNHNSNWKSFMFSTFLIFIIAEIWELPIIINNLLIQNLEGNFKMLSVTSLKFLSIPFLMFEYKKNSWEKTKLSWQNSIYQTNFIVFTLAIFGMLFWFTIFWRTVSVSEILYIPILLKLVLACEVIMIAKTLKGERETWIS